MADGNLDLVIVGAGFAGMYMLHRARAIGLSARVFEAGSGVGGTWYWNRYPGARCDVESMEYSYQFSDELQQEWDWTERYAAQPEILRYANHVADRFDLRRDIRFDTRVRAAAFDEPQGRWVIETDDGARTAATWCVMATGCLSSTNLPDFDGLDRFPRGLVPHRPLAAPRGRFHRPAGRRDRDRLVGGPVDPPDRAAGGASVRVPAHAEPRGARAQRSDGSAGSREGQGRTTPPCAPAPSRTGPACSTGSATSRRWR